MPDSSNPYEPASPADLDLERLVDTEVGQWPPLARSWIDRGYSSQALTDFAALSPAESAVLADLMIDVLRSLGVEVAVDGHIAEHVFTISGFERRCRQAVAKPGLDLQRTWRDVEVGVRASDQWGTPPVLVQTRVGDYNSVNEALTAGMSNTELVETSAKQMIDTLQEHIGVRWPLCIEHGGVMTPYSPAPGSAGEPSVDPSWWCLAHEAPVARIGELTTSVAIFKTLWWCDERELPPRRG